MYKILVFDRGFSPDSHRPVGDFANPLGQHAVPSGIFKSPPGSGDLGENPLPITRIFYINLTLALFLSENNKNTMYRVFLPQMKQQQDETQSVIFNFNKKNCLVKPSS